MSLDKDQLHLLVDCLSFLDTHYDKLNQFERDFLTSQKERYEEYGENIRLSDKQINVLQKTYDKVILGVQPKWAR